MNNRKNKQLRRAVRREVDDNSRRFLLAILGNNFIGRIRWALVIIFRLGYKDLIIGWDDGIGIYLYEKPLDY